MKIYHGGPGYKEDERMHWLSKKSTKIIMIMPAVILFTVFFLAPIFISVYYRIGNSDTGCVYGIYYYSYWNVNWI